MQMRQPIRLPLFAFVQYECALMGEGSYTALSAYPGNDNFILKIRLDIFNFKNNI